MLKKLTFKKLFLLDAIGATITALLLSQLLARLQSFFGMPKNILHGLAAIAVCFAIYSFTCYFKAIEKNWKLLMKGIAVANTLYCLITLTLVIYLYNTLSWIGIAYFIGEIMVIFILVRIENGYIQKRS